MKRFKATVLCTVALMVAGIFISSFVTPAHKSPVCEEYGYFNVSGGSSNPYENHPWDNCGSSSIIHGLDPRTIELYPTFGSGSTYTITKLASNPSWLFMGTVGGYKAYFTFTTHGQSMTIQVTQDTETHVINFAFAP